MMLNRIIFIFIIINCSLQVFAQDKLPADIKNAIDSTLKLNDMRMSDLWLPLEMHSYDKNRLKHTGYLFRNPLYLNEFITYHGKELTSINKDRIFPYTARIVEELGYKKLELLDLKSSVSNDIMNNNLHTNLDSLLDFNTGMIFRPFINLFINTKAWMLKDILQSENDSIKYLMNNIDSVLIFNVDSIENIYDYDRAVKFNQEKSKKLVNLTDIFNKSRVFDIGVSLYLNIMELSERLKSLPKEVKSKVKTSIINTKFGRIAIGGTGDDIYTGNFVMIIDLGGNDTYNFESLNKQFSYFSPVRFIVDFDGNDKYYSGDFSLASGFFGTNILLDYSGDDFYFSHNFSMGSGIFGFGILEDFHGNDTYSSNLYSQGMAFFGIGLMIEHHGNDVYKCRGSAQGYGGTRGFGAIADISGSDYYISSSDEPDVIRDESNNISMAQGTGQGLRNYSSGGIGIIADKSGNDNYLVDMFGQGVGFWYGTGGIYDESGDDMYSGYQYVQGNGIHYAAGILMDISGNDIYSSHSISQGCGHDQSYGALFDFDGNDKYIADNLAMGAGNSNSISILFDKLGNDSYIVSNMDNSMGYSDLRRQLGMIGLFVDASGNDIYPDNSTNNYFKKKGSYGILNDFDVIEKVEKKKPEEESIKINLPNNIDSLLKIAANPISKFRDNVKPAIDKLISIGTPVLEYIKPRMANGEPREKRAIDAILMGLIKKDSNAVISLVRDSLYSDEYTTYLSCMTTITLGKLYPLKPVIHDLLKSKNLRTRDNAATVFTFLGDTSDIPFLLPLLEDNYPYVRGRAALAIAKIFPENVLTLLKNALSDTSQIIRNSVVVGLSGRKEFTSEFAIELFSMKISEAMREKLSFVIINSDFNEKSFKDLRNMILQQSDPIKKIIYTEIVKKKDKNIKQRIKEMIKFESNQELRSILEHE